MSLLFTIIFHNINYKQQISGCSNNIVNPLERDLDYVINFACNFGDDLMLRCGWIICISG